jgi:hypothetical protein
MMAKSSAPRQTSKRRVVGRPTGYRPEFCDKARRFCENGATDREVAEALGIHTATYYRWRAEHAEFCEATRVGKELADARVEASLYHRAIGYSFSAVKIFMPAGAKEPVYAPYVEHVPPETAAASLWLRNRQPTKWRDKTEHELSGKLTLEQLVALSGLRAGAERNAPPNNAEDD